MIPLLLMPKQPVNEMQQPITKYFKKKSGLCLVTSLSDAVLINIASFLNAPDTYNLSQTCKEFHKPSTELSTRHFLSPPESDPLEYSQNNAVTNVASRLIQESLFHGLLRVFQQSNASITIDQIRDLVKFQVEEMNKGRKVLLSGSAVVQAATGKLFHDFDLDFFSCRSSAAGFRDLMLSFGYCCESVLPCYGEHGAYHRLGETRFIHHVERYVPISEVDKIEGIGQIVRRYYRAWNAHMAAEQADEEVPSQNVDMSYMNFRNMCLSKIQKNKYHRFPKNYPFTKLRTKSGRKGASIELIVCRSSPEETLTRFDLDICKCSFDGQRTKVVSIHDTFNSRTKSDQRMEFINCYMPNFLKLAPKYNAMLEYGHINELLSHLKTQDTTNDMIMHIMHCFIRTSNMVDPRTNHAVFGTRELSLLNSNEDIELNPHFFLALHNKLIKQFKRALKYSKRKIDVPISHNLKQLFLDVHKDEGDFAPPLKRARY